MAAMARDWAAGASAPTAVAAVEAEEAAAAGSGGGARGNDGLGSPPMEGRGGAHGDRVIIALGAANVERVVCDGCAGPDCCLSCGCGCCTRCELRRARACARLRWIISCCSAVSEHEGVAGFGGGKDGFAATIARRSASMDPRTSAKPSATILRISAICAARRSASAGGAAETVRAMNEVESAWIVTSLDGCFCCWFC